VVGTDTVRKHEKPISFDGVFSEDSTQHTIFETSALPLVDACCNGYNGTIFAYGQTSSGKTYTMNGTTMHPGVMYRTFDHLFEMINESGPETKYLVSCSYVQIYNEEIYDLLARQANPQFVAIPE